MKFNKTVLKNGLRVITVPMAESPAVTVLVLVEAGSKYESKKENGISHFLEHMFFKGTTRRPSASAISQELDSVGAMYNAFTGQEYTGYYAKVASKHMRKALDIISDMFTDSLLNEEEMTKEKGVILEEMRMYQDMPQRHVQDLFMKVVYGDQPIGWNIVGTEETIKSFDRNHFADYRMRLYNTLSTIVVISGSFDESKVISDVEKAFAKMPVGKEKFKKEKVIEKQDKPALLTSFKETDQTHLVIGVRTFDIFSKHEPVLKVLSTVLGRGMSSRLFVKLREEMGVCYYVRADHDPYTDHGLMTVSAGVDNKRVEEVTKVILNELKKTTTELVSKEELDKVKDYMLGTSLLGLETSDAQGEFFGFQETVKGELKTFDEISAEIRAVTAEDIMNTAKAIFKDEGLNMAIIGRYKKDSPEEIALKDILTFA